MTKTDKWNLEGFLENFHPEPVRTVAKSYLESIGVAPDDDDVNARAAYDTLGAVVHRFDDYADDRTPPALRAVTSAWLELSDELREGALLTLGRFGRPTHISAFVGYGEDFDSARNAHIIFTLFSMAEAGELWFVDLEDDSGVFGLLTHYKPESTDEAWELLERVEDWPAAPPVFDDGSVQGELGLEVEHG